MLVARELVAQGLQGLVRGQRALGVVRLRRVRRQRVARLQRRGLIGLARLDDLLAVRLPARVGLGVLPLPFGALLLRAGLPLAGLRIEAVGTDVVAGLVERRGHAVQVRVELLAGHAVGRVIGLLERQRDAATLEVDVDDAHEDVVIDLDDLLGQLDVTLGELGDVHQALDALLDANERTEGNELGDLAGHDLADLVGPREVLPGILLRRLQRKRDALAVHVDVEHLDRDLLADLDDLGRVVDVLPGQLGYVHEAVDSAKIDEGAEVDDGRDDAAADLALLQLREEGLADLALRLLEPGTARQDHVVAVLVELDDLCLEGLTDVGLQVAHATHLDEGRGQEAAEPDVEDEAALDDLDDLALDDAVLFLDALDRAPGALVLGALLGQDQPAFLVLLGEDEGLDVVTHGDDLAGIDIVLDAQLARGDDALGLVADVEEDLVAVHLDDGALDDVAVIEVLDRRVDRGHEVLGGADVIDGDLGRGRRRSSYGHLVGILR